MLNDVLNIEKKHEMAASTLFDRVMQSYTPNHVVAISGEVGAGKCEIAHVLGRKLIAEGISVKVMHMDNFYKIPPLERAYWRKQNGVDKIGYDEYDWARINKVLEDFKESRESIIPVVDLFTQKVDELHTDFKGIDVLLIEGLYSIKLEQANLRVFIELTYEETWDEQLMAGKEKIDAFRLEVLKQEHKAVQSLKKFADFYIDFNTSGEFHL